jgi:hypothetical protein
MSSKNKQKKCPLLCNGCACGKGKRRGSDSYYGQPPLKSADNESFQLEDDDDKLEEVRKLLLQPLLVCGGCAAPFIKDN